MRNILRNSLIASAVAVVGATAFVGKANAQSVDVDFTGSVPSTCTITKLADGVLGPTNNASTLDLSKNLKCLLYNAFSDFNGLRSLALGGRKNKALGELIELIYQLARKR
ncbi:hypothetical protein CDG76_17000 [Nostoc sp. 'Peltigera membranacea cyanobiont' 210A]|nr:hypothetical protein CDG76_17000 [Nostoc sp. 'Peltigera membranacea cyanobiont' 210A]